MSSARISRSRRVFSLRKIIARERSVRGVSDACKTRLAGCDVVCGIAELADAAQFIFSEDILGVQLDPEVEERVRELRGIRGRVGLEELLSTHVADVWAREVGAVER